MDEVQWTLVESDQVKAIGYELFQVCVDRGWTNAELYIALTEMARFLREYCGVAVMHQDLEARN